MKDAFAVYRMKAWPPSEEECHTLGRRVTPWCDSEELAEEFGQPRGGSEIRVMVRYAWDSGSSQMVVVRILP